MEIEADRKEQREELDQAMNDQFVEISNVSMTESDDMNQFILKGADSSRAYLLEQNKLLKAGKISPAVYKQNLQRQKNSWGILDETIKTYDAEMKRLGERVESGVASQAEIDAYQSLAAMGDFTNRQFYTDPATGASYIVTNDENGNIIKYNSIKELGNVKNVKIDKIDLTGQVNARVKTLGKHNGVTADGKYIIGQEMSPTWDKDKQAIIGAVLNSDKAIISTLTDYGKIPTITPKEWDALPDSEKGNYMVRYVDGNGQTQFQITDALRKKAQDIVSETIDSQVDRIEDWKQAQSNEVFEETKRHNRAMEGAAYARATKPTQSGGKSAPVLSSRYKYLTDLANNASDPNLRGRLIGKRSNLGVVTSTGYNKNGDLVLTFNTGETNPDGTAISKQKIFTSRTARMQIANDLLNDGLGQNDWVSWEDLDLFAGGYFDVDTYDQESGGGGISTLDALATTLNANNRVQSADRGSVRPGVVKGLNLGSISFGGN